ncbi:MAG: hypothetical protein Q4C95_00075 [Planctomycetia bacterium]|nr:hypothetical protein [Planctomycetia bacterium]
MSNNETDFETKSGSLFSQNWSLSNEQSLDESSPKNISILAILSLIGGFLSFTVFFSMNFLFVPIITLLLIIIAAINIKRSEGLLIGRSFLLIGLWLLLIPGISKPLMDYVYSQNLYKNADVFFTYWFETAKKGDFVKLQQLQSGLAVRNPISDEAGFWKNYIRDEETHEATHRFLTNRTLLTLAALGDQAQCRLYRVDACYFSAGNEESVIMTYAITYPKGNDKETFFVSISGKRFFIHNSDFDKKKYTWVVDNGAWTPLKLDDQGKPVSPLKKKG